MRARKTSVDIFIILLFWISQKYNFASPARNTQNWIQFGEHLVSYDDAVMHVAMLMDRCTKWSWCSPPSPPPKKKVDAPTLESLSPPVFTLHPLPCFFLCWSWSTLIWSCISCASHLRCSRFRTPSPPRLFSSSWLSQFWSNLQI